MQFSSVKWGKVSFQYLGGGTWAKSFRQDVMMPPGNEMFLIRISRQTLVCLKCCSSGHVCIWQEEGKEREALWCALGSTCSVELKLGPPCWQLPSIPDAFSRGPHIPCEGGWGLHV